MSTAIDWGAEAARIRAKPAVKRGSPERSIQRSVVVWLRQVLPLGSVVAAIINEQRGSGQTPEQRARFGAARKATGTLTGMTDLVAAVANGPVLFIELKAPGGVVSPAQAEVHARLRAAGHIVLLADSIESMRLGLHEAGIATREARGGEMRAPKVRGIA